MDSKGIAIAITSRLHQRTSEIQNIPGGGGHAPSPPPLDGALRARECVSTPIAKILRSPLSRSDDSAGFSCTSVNSGRGQTVTARALTSGPSRFYRLATSLNTQDT